MKRAVPDGTSGPGLGRKWDPLRARPSAAPQALCVRARWVGRGQQWSAVCHRRPCGRHEEPGGGGVGGGAGLPLPLLEGLRGRGVKAATSPTSPQVLPLPQPAEQLPLPLALPTVQKTTILPLLAQTQLQREDLGGAAGREAGDLFKSNYKEGKRRETTFSLLQLSLPWSPSKVKSLR